MSKILLFALPLRSAINADLKLAKSLRARGHEVVFAGMADCRPMVEPYGFRCLPIFTDWFPEGFIDQWRGGPTARASFGDTLKFYLDERRKMVEHAGFVEFLIKGGHAEFTREVRAAEPDILLIDNALHPYWAVMAAASGVRMMYISHILPITEDPLVPPFNSLLEPARDLRSRLGVGLAWKRHAAGQWLQRKALRAAGVPDSTAQIKRLARACGYPPKRLNTRTALFPQLDFPVLVMCPEEFDFPEARGRANVLYAEAAVDTERDEAAFPWERIEPDKKLVYCSLGSVAYNQPFFQSVIDAAAAEPDWQLVANVGSALSPSDFRNVPASAVLVNGAPQLALLKRAHAMVNHGGIGSVRECVYFGVPQVVFPIGFDQPGAAARVRRHGLGVVGSFRDATPETVRTLLAQVLTDGRFKARSEAMSETFRSREREQAAAAAVERFLAS